MNFDEEAVCAQMNVARIQAEIPIQLAEREEAFSVRLEKAKMNPQNKLGSLYSFMDELFKFASNYTPCKKGCSDCCHYTVAISEVEILYIEKNTKVKRNKVYIPNQDFHGIPCPFLVEDCCSIYKARPFVCRKHVTLAPTNFSCNTDICKDRELPLLQFTGVCAAFGHILQVSGVSGADDFYDIRQVFSPKPGTTNHAPIARVSG